MKGYDPKLRDAMDEIKSILQEYDIGGFISLNSKTHGEFKIAIDLPTWSVVKFTEDEKAVRVKFKKEQKEEAEATIAMIANMRDLSAMLFMQSDQIIAQIEKHVQVDHVPFGGGITNEDRQ